MRLDGPGAGWGANWQYKGQPCEVVGIDFDVESKQVIAIFINTGVGPDIRAEFEDLEYEIRKLS